MIARYLSSCATRALTGLRRFRQREDGTATIEFAIVIPAFLFLLMNTVELGLITIQQCRLITAISTCNIVNC